MITREFNLNLHAGHSIPLVINASQYDRGEQWVFTLLNSDGTQYRPNAAAIAGTKSDGNLIVNAATVDSDGRVVVSETEQMTAAAGKAKFELLLDDQTHGTANFVVLVEASPADEGVPSASDLSLIQQAIDGTSSTAIAAGVSAWMSEHLTPTTPVVDASLTVQGAAADAKKTGDELNDLKSQIAQGSGVPAEVKQAISTLLSSAMYSGSDMADEKAIVLAWASQITAITLNQSSISISGTGTYQLVATTVPSGGAVSWASSDPSVATVSSNGLVTGVGNGTATITASSGELTATCTANVTGFATLTSISADYTQSGTIYPTDSLESLIEDLVVTAHYSDSTSQIITGYTLNGELTVGTSTITVAYKDQSDTFNVTVTRKPVTGWYYPFNGSLASEGTKDFNFVGQGVYGVGHDDRQAYYHIIPTSGDATSDSQLGLYAVNLAEFPNLSGDFTISYWFASQIQSYQHPIWMTIYTGTGNPTQKMVSSATFETPWTGNYDGFNSKTYSGFAVQGSSSGKFILRITNSTNSRSSQIQLTIPSGFDTTTWHHYAITKKDTTLRLFIDGAIVCTATLINVGVYASNQIAVLCKFEETVANASTVSQISNGGKMQDLYIAESCKWESAFDPEAITY